MKKTLFVLSFLLVSSASTFAATEQDQNAAVFLGGNGYIELSSDYKLDSTITRREMLKVMMNLSGKSIASTCSGKFLDLPSSDWGCKYAEAALANGYISANSYFRPNDSVTNIEALKMVMQAGGIPKSTKYLYGECFNDCPLYSWEEQYFEGAKKYHLTDNYVDNKDTYFEFSKYAIRGKVFSMSARTQYEYRNNREYWLTYNTDLYLALYPEFFHTSIQNNSTVYFGDSYRFEGDYSVVTTTNSYDEYLENIKNTELDSTEYIFTDVSGNQKGKSVLVSTPYYTKQYVYFSGKNGMNFVLSGKIDIYEDNYFEIFYKSFQIK